jgi:hypothetical protein
VRVVGSISAHAISRSFGHKALFLRLWVSKLQAVNDKPIRENDLLHDKSTLYVPESISLIKTRQKTLEIWDQGGSNICNIFKTPTVSAHRYYNWPDSYWYDSLLGFELLHLHHFEQNGVSV